METKNTKKIGLLAAALVVLLALASFVGYKIYSASTAAELNPAMCETTKARFDRVVQGNSCYPDLGTSTTHIEADLVKYCGAEEANAVTKKFADLTADDLKKMCEANQK